MTKKKYQALAALTIVASAYFFFQDRKVLEEVPSKISATHSPAQPNQIVKQAALETGVVAVARTPASVGYVNIPSPEWQERLEESLKEQAGDSLKEIQIKKERSFVWKMDSSPIMVESVVVTMTNKQEAQSSFRALVDAQTGKVLETWDRTIFDPADANKARLGIALDPRYTN